MDCWNGGRVKNKIKKYDIPNISQPILSIVIVLFIVCCSESRDEVIYGNLIIPDISRFHDFTKNGNYSGIPNSGYLRTLKILTSIKQHCFYS